MKVLLDTNVIVDNLIAREPFQEQAKLILELMAKGEFTGCMSASSVTDVYYILRRTFSDAECRKKIEGLLYVIQASEVTKDDCLAALKSPISDFEDALVAVCADKIGADYIITRDKEFLSYSKAISPEEFLKLM